MKVVIVKISRNTSEKPHDMSAEVEYAISVEAEDFLESLALESLQSKDVKVEVVGLGVFYRK